MITQPNRYNALDGQQGGKDGIVSRVQADRPVQRQAEALNGVVGGKGGMATRGIAISRPALPMYHNPRTTFCK